MTSRKKLALQVLGNKIRQGRMKVGMSQKDLARVLKITDKSISAYEVGRIEPPLAILKKMSVLFHIPLSSFDSKAVYTRTELLQKLSTIEHELVEIKRMILDEGSVQLKK